MKVIIKEGDKKCEHNFVPIWQLHAYTREDSDVCTKCGAKRIFTHDKFLGKNKKFKPIK